MQQETNIPMKGNKSNNHANNFLINTKKHAIPELALSDLDSNEQTQLFSYIQSINSIYLLNATIAYQCIKIFPNKGIKRKRKNEKKLRQA